MNQHKNYKNLAFVNMQSVLFQPLVATFVFLGVNHDAQASEHLNPTQQHTNNNPENSLTKALIRQSNLQIIKYHRSGSIKSNK